MNIYLFTVSIVVVTAFSFGLTGCGEKDSKKLPVISNVSYQMESLDTQSNIASVHVTATIENENSSSIYDNGISLNFISGNGENGYINLSAGGHNLKICATNSDGQVCSNEELYFVSENVVILDYETYIIKDISHGISNNGVNIVYGTMSGKIYTLELDSKSSTEIADVRERVSGLVFIDKDSCYYSNILITKIKKLTISSSSIENIASTPFPDGLDFYKGRIYAVTNDVSGILTIFNTNGEQNSTLDTGIDDIVGMSHTDNYLYILSENGLIYQTNPTSGASKEIFSNQNLFNQKDENKYDNGLESITILNNYIYLSFVYGHTIYRINVNLSKYE